MDIEIFHKGIVLLRLDLWGIDISITNQVLSMWLATFAIFIVLYLGVLKTKIIPGAWQNLVEAAYELFEDNFKDTLGEHGRAFVPFLFTLFLFIFSASFLSLIPAVPAIYTNINVTASLAIMVFVFCQLIVLKNRGPLGYFKHLIPEGVPPYLFGLIIPIEILGQLARPFSLSIRLFANNLAGHTVVFVLLSLLLVFKSIWIVPFPVLGSILVSSFEVFVALIQAYIFSYLSATYIADSLG